MKMSPEGENRTSRAEFAVDEVVLVSVSTSRVAQSARARSERVIVRLLHDIPACLLSDDGCEAKGDLAIDRVEDDARHKSRCG